MVRSRLGVQRWLLWGIALVVVLVAAIAGSFLYRAVPSSAPEIGSFVRDIARLERSTARPYLGITYQELNTRTMEHSDIPAMAGAMVASVVPGSPAAMGGLGTGDVILAVNGEALGSENTLLKVLLKRQPGDRVRLMVQRGQEHLSLEVVVGKQ
ncbi:MAG: PDZ domain-containing protein [Dehalococcoidia bacterium]|nr:PDZ domain-containing protein [Dehalococcoidia bacterium]